MAREVIQAGTARAQKLTFWSKVLATNFERWWVIHGGHPWNLIQGAESHILEHNSGSNSGARVCTSILGRKKLSQFDRSWAAERGQNLEMKLLDSWTTCLIFDVKHLSVEPSQGAPGLFPFLPPRPRLDMEQPCSLVGPCRSWQALPCPLPRASSSHTVARRTYSAARRGTHVRPGAPHRALPSHPPPSGTLQPARPPDPPSRFTALQLPSLHFLGISQQNLTLNFTLKVSI